MVRSETHSLSPDLLATGEAVRNAMHFMDAVRCPGLTAGAQEIRRLTGDLPKRLAVFSYRCPTPCAWVVFAGGTGTGKSTLFNALCGKPLSEMGIERPKTGGPIVYSYQGSPIEKHFPFPSVQMNGTLQRIPIRLRLLECRGICSSWNTTETTGLICLL